jgi:hypothetical protein
VAAADINTGMTAAATADTDTADDDCRMEEAVATAELQQAWPEKAEQKVQQHVQPATHKRQRSLGHQSAAASAAASVDERVFGSTGATSCLAKRQRVHVEQQQQHLPAAAGTAEAAAMQQTDAATGSETVTAAAAAAAAAAGMPQDDVANEKSLTRTGADNQQQQQHPLVLADGSMPCAAGLAELQQQLSLQLPGAVLDGQWLVYRRKAFFFVV